jgi:hypothetical protein
LVFSGVPSGVRRIPSAGLLEEGEKLAVVLEDDALAETYVLDHAV